MQPIWASQTLTFRSVEQSNVELDVKGEFWSPFCKLSKLKPPFSNKTHSLFAKRSCKELICFIFSAFPIFCNCEVTVALWTDGTGQWCARKYHRDPSCSRNVEHPHVYILSNWQQLATATFLAAWYCIFMTWLAIDVMEMQNLCCHHHTVTINRKGDIFCKIDFLNYTKNC